MEKYENYNTKIPIRFQEKWVSALNSLVKINHSFDAVITRYNKPFLEIFKTSETASNLFKEGLTFDSNELFCDLVIKDDNLIAFSNVLEKKSLKNYKAVQSGYIAYLGLPLKWPSGEIFGTLCINYKKTHKFSKETRLIVCEIKALIEAHLEIIVKDMKIHSDNAILISEENKYRKLVNQAPIGIFETTASGKIISINNSMSYILGFSCKEEVLKHYNDLKKDLYVNPDRRQQFIHELNINDEVKNFEYEALGKNKEHIWISMNAKKKKCIKLEDFLIQGFAFDITKRKKKDRELIEQKQELIKAYEQLTTYNEEILAMNEELEDSLDQINSLNKRYTNMIELVSKTNKRNILNESDFFYNLLARAIEIIPEADYGKIGLINDKNKFEFIDTIGHDIKILKNLKFDKNILFNKDNSKVNYSNGYFFNIDKIEREKKDFLKALKPIKESLYINIIVEGKTVGRVSLEIMAGSDKEFSDTTRKVLESFATLASSFFAFKKFDDLQNNFTKEIITSIIKIMEMYDLYTKGHSESVATIASVIAKGMNLSKKSIQDTYWAGLVHDIGKLLIPLNILNKKEKLTDSEYEFVKKHPIWGNKALKHSKVLKPIANYILHHHEKWDGSGYPEGLKGDEIPLIAQIIALADAWDAMLSKRAYRDSLSFDEALKEIKRNKGTQFSPNVVEAFIKIIENETIEKLKQDVLKNEINAIETDHNLVKKDMNYEILFEESNEGIVILDDDFNIIRVNRHFSSMFGFNQEKIIGSNIKRIVPKEKISETKKIMEKLKHDEKVYAKTTRQKSNNKKIPVSIQGFPISLNESHMGYYLIYRDMTELEEAKMQYRAIKDRYEILFDNEDISMLIIDPDSGQIIDANSAAANFYGWKKSELKIKNISEINTLSKDEITIEMLKAKSKKKKRFIFNHKIASGNIKEVEVYSHPIKFGERDYLYSIIHDHK